MREVCGERIEDLRAMIDQSVIYLRHDTEHEKRLMELEQSNVQKVQELQLNHQKESFIQQTEQERLKLEEQNLVETNARLAEETLLKCTNMLK